MCKNDYHDSCNVNPCCFSCCDKKEFTTDKLCCDFAVTATVEENATNLFTADPSTACDLVVSGNIKNCGNVEMVVVFLRGVAIDGTGGTVVRTLQIPAGGCATFTVRGIDAINAYIIGSIDETPVAGEICIIERFRVH